MTSSVQYIPGNWQVGDVVEVKGESTSIDRKIELLRTSWYLAKIKKVEDLIPNLPRFLVQLEDFDSELLSWVTEEDFRLPLSYESIQDNEPVEIGQIVEIASSIDDGNGTEPISWWEATILEDKGESIKVQFKNENWHDEGQSWKLVDRMDIRKGEPHSSRSWRLETYHSLERTFLKKLTAFMKTRSTPLKYNGNNSLFKLFAIVTSMGGIKKVNATKGAITRVWKRCPNYNQASTNGASTVKELYMKLLKPFEDEYCKFSDDSDQESHLLSLANTGQRKRKVIHPYLGFSDEDSNEEEEDEEEDEEFSPVQKKATTKQAESENIVQSKTRVDQGSQTKPEMRDASTQTGVVVLFGKEVVV